MSEVSRTQRSAKNAAVGVITQVLTLLLSFVTRTVFITILGVELVGVNQLLISVLAMLAIADLGVSWALMYALYPALASGDEARISAVVRYSATIYRWIAMVVALLGLAVLPFLDRLVSMKSPPEHLWAYYVVLLVNTVATYLMLYRTVLLNADQRMFVTKLYAFAFSTARSLVQIVMLFVFESFLLYLAVQTIFTVANNLALYVKVGRIYPYLKVQGARLDRASRATIRESVRAMMIYRVGGLVLNNSDPILISVIVGTIALGYYSNYSLIVGALTMVAEVAFAALAPSVGNLVATRGGEAARSVLYEISLLAIAVYGIVSVILVLSLDDVITVWLGNDFALGSPLVIAMVANFYAMGIMSPIFSFRAATGMFKKTRYVFVLTAILNILLSIIFGLFWGVEGIVLATLTARLLTNMWYEPFVLFKEHLAGGLARYVILHFWGLLALATPILLLMSLPSPGDSLGDAVLRSLAGAVAAVFLLLPLLLRTSEGRGLTRRLGALFANWHR